MTPLLKAIIDEIEGWSDGHEVKVGMVNDGDDHYDFMGLIVMAVGRARIGVVVQNWIIQNVNTNVVPHDEGNDEALIYNFVHLLRDGPTYRRYDYQPDQDAELVAWGVMIPKV